MVDNEIALEGHLIADGRYAVRGRLGDGNMGVVYVARDNRLETDVVVKVPTVANLGDEEFRERFRREVRSLVKLGHPHVVPIIDVGEHEGAPFVVMQYLTGGSLADRMPDDEQQGLPLDSLRDWLPALARALDFVHHQGCVHRDVKPANILFDADGNAFLSDFGLSKVLAEEGGAGEQSLTAAGFLVGTPNYVAPEIVMGHDYDGRVDQYALAITVYQVLSGSCPLEGPTASATMVNQTSRMPAPLRKAVPGIPARVSRAVQKALAKDPDDRFPSCVAFARAVLRPPGAGSSQKVDVQNVPPPRTRQPPPRVAAGASRLPPKVGSRGSSRRGKSTTGSNGRIPCPTCRKVLPVKREYAGRIGRCVHCRQRLRIGHQARKLTILPESRGPVTDTDRNSNSATSSRPRPADDELLIGERLFGIELGKRVAVALAAVLIVLIVGVSIYLGRVSNAATPEEQLQKDVEKIGSREGE